MTTHGDMNQQRKIKHNLNILHNCTWNVLQDRQHIRSKNRSNNSWLLKSMKVSFPIIALIKLNPRNLQPLDIAGWVNTADMCWNLFRSYHVGFWGFWWSKRHRLPEFKYEQILPMSKSHQPLWSQHSHLCNMATAVPTSLGCYEA